MLRAFQLIAHFWHTSFLGFCDPSFPVSPSHPSGRSPLSLLYWVLLLLHPISKCWHSKAQSWVFTPHATLSPEASSPIPIALEPIFISYNTQMYTNSLCSELQIPRATLLFNISIRMSHNDHKPNGPQPKTLILPHKFALPPLFPTSFHVIAQARSQSSLTYPFLSLTHNI